VSPATDRARRPLVTVLTPVHNGEAYIAECIESVLAQTYDHWEYVISDNASTDRSAEIARRYAARDPRIRVHSTQRLLHVIASENEAFRQVSPESVYCKMIHADDWLFPDCLRQMVDLAEAHPTVGVVGAYRLDGTRVDLDGLPYPSTVVPGRELCRAMLLGGPRVFGSPSAIMFRSEFVRRQPMFFDETDFHADVAACYRVLQDSDFGFIHQVLTFTRTHPGEQSGTASRLKTYIAGRFRHLVEYGPTYLSPEEYPAWLEETIKRYYRFLARSLVRPRAGEIWKYHRAALAAAGHPFSWWTMLKVLVPYWGYALRHPGEVGRLLTRAGSQVGRAPGAAGLPVSGESHRPSPAARSGSGQEDSR
jgi:glycosyltransferase involved in cell wall biosynthesis